MKSINRAILVGRLAADPETRQTEKGTTITTFPLATNRSFSSNGEKKSVTDFHRIVAWSKLGVICAKYLEKGQIVYVEGMILNRAYETDGERKYVTEIRADDVSMLTVKKSHDATTVTLESPDAPTT